MQFMHTARRHAVRVCARESILQHVILAKSHYHHRAYYADSQPHAMPRARPQPNGQTERNHTDITSHTAQRVYVL